MTTFLYCFTVPPLWLLAFKELLFYKFPKHNFFKKKKHDIHWGECLSQSCKLSDTKFSLKVWNTFFQVVGQGQGSLRPSKQYSCYHSSWSFITLGFKTYYWTYPILGSQDMDKSRLWWSRSFHPHGDFSKGQKLLWILLGERSHQESNSSVNPKSYNN